MIMMITIIIIMMMMVMMMMIALKDAISRFFAISSLRRELSPIRTLKWPVRNRVQITCNTPGVHHVQHVMCHVVSRDSSATKVKLTEFKLQFV